MRAASKPKIKAKAKAKVKPVKARVKTKPKLKRKQSAAALDVAAALESARASVALVNETEKAHTLKAAAECYRELMASRTEDAETAYIFSESHPTPHWITTFGCDGGCLKDRPEVPWAAHQEVNLAYASERLARVGA